MSQPSVSSREEKGEALESGSAAPSLASDAFEAPVAEDAMESPADWRPWEPIDDARFFEAQLERKEGALRELAERDPRRAWAWAEKGRNAREREALRLAALQGWGVWDAEEALRMAMELPEGERESGVLAVMKGAALQPELARKALTALARQEAVSGHVRARARLSLVESLGRNGHFAEALRLSLAEGSGSERSALLDASFAQWGRYEPEEAVLAAMEMEAKSERDRAYGVLIAAWAETAPSGLAEFADRLPDGKERTLAMKASLQRWVAEDPAEASDWLAAREPSPEYDAGVLALASHPYLAERSPRVAVSWAESLWDENLRADTIAHVVKQWAASDRNAAVAYVRSSSDLRSTERQELLALFGEKLSFGIDGDR